MKDICERYQTPSISVKPCPSLQGLHEFQSKMQAQPPFRSASFTCRYARGHVNRSRSAGEHGMRSRRSAAPLFTLPCAVVPHLQRITLEDKQLRLLKDFTA